MDNISFSKIKNTALCFMCRKNHVPLAFWNKPCDECKAKLKSAAAQPISVQKSKIIEAVKLGKKMPAARLEKDKTRTTPREEIYVDKYGNKVDNPGYDPISDPRGWRATGTLKDKGTAIYGH